MFYDGQLNQRDGLRASGRSRGTFWVRDDYGTATSPLSVAIGNLNADGDPDLVVANYGSNAVSVLLGNGDGTFGTKIDYGTGSLPTCSIDWWHVAGAGLPKSRPRLGHLPARSATRGPG